MTSYLYLLVLLYVVSHQTVGSLAMTRNGQDNNKISETRHCDRNYCHSIVSKCKSRTRDCSCNIKKDVQCAKRCLLCLEEKFGKCCACVGLCPALKEDIYSSHVGDIEGSSYEELFSTLTETDDIHNRWSVETSLSSREFLHPEYGKIEITLDENNKLKLLPHDTAAAAAAATPNVITSNSDNVTNTSSISEKHQQVASDDRQKCVVAFINHHLSMTNCKRYCRSMGASSFRWFEEGCCECVGKFCIHYGVNEPKCSIEYD